MAEVEKRRYVRHPIRVPLAVRPRDGSPGFLSRVADLSEGGVSFVSEVPLAVGSTAEVDIPVRKSLFTLEGTVVTCLEQRKTGGFRIGLSFASTELNFRLKLAEQILRIDELRSELSRERGAEVSSGEAARVWVERYAETFADLFPGS